MNECEYRILSEDYRDIPLGFDISSGSLFPGDNLNDDKCVIKITDNLYILYVEASGVSPLNSAEYRYQYIPKCYGLQNDLSVLNDSGILQVSRQPLSLTGQGVILGFLDTGIRYRLPAFRNEDGSTRLSVCGIRRHSRMTEVLELVTGQMKTDCSHRTVFIMELNTQEKPSTAIWPKTVLFFLQTKTGMGQR